MRGECGPHGVIAEVKILKAQDLDDAVTLDLQVFGGWWSLQGYKRELKRANSDLLGLRLQSKISSPDSPALSIPSASELIGIGCLWRVVDEAHITMLGIHPQYQRRGLGQALLWSLLKMAQLHQSARATLEVNVLNSTAVALYQKFGFQTAGRRPQYYDNGDDALIMWQGGLQSSQFLRSLQVWQQETEQRLAAWNCQALQIDFGEINTSLQ